MIKEHSLKFSNKNCITIHCTEMHKWWRPLDGNWEYLKCSWKTTLCYIRIFNCIFVPLRLEKIRIMMGHATYRQMDKKFKSHTCWLTRRVAWDFVLFSEQCQINQNLKEKSAYQLLYSICTLSTADKCHVSLYPQWRPLQHHQAELLLL